MLETNIENLKLVASGRATTRSGYHISFFLESLAHLLYHLRDWILRDRFITSSHLNTKL